MRSVLTTKYVGFFEHQFIRGRRLAVNKDGGLFLLHDDAEREASVLTGLEVV
jgi:hypothetical protein